MAARDTQSAASPRTSRPRKKTPSKTVICETFYPRGDLGNITRRRGGRKIGKRENLRGQYISILLSHTQPPPAASSRDRIGNGLNNGLKIIHALRFRETGIARDQRGINAATKRAEIESDEDRKTRYRETRGDCGGGFLR